MHTERDEVVSALRRRGDHDRALQATCALPPDVDTERDRSALTSLGVSPETLGLPVVETDEK